MYNSQLGQTYLIGVEIVRRDFASKYVPVQSLQTLQGYIFHISQPI